MKKIYFIILILVISLVTGSGISWAVEVNPGGGVDFSQVNQEFELVSIPYSDWGSVNADFSDLQASTGHANGYINIYIDGVGWAVQNMRVDSSSSDLDEISTYFDLGSTGEKTSIQAYVDFSPTPSESFPDPGSYETFPVSQIGYNAEGYSAETTVGLGAPPVPGVITFESGGLLDLHWHLGVPNVQAADNQCLPMSVANSLQWLENTYPRIVVPHDHKIGLRTDVPNDSLVGQLELAMGRAVVNRWNGDTLGALPGLQGKLQYLSNNPPPPAIPLGRKLTVKFQGRSVTLPGGGKELPAGNVNFAGLTAFYKGATVTADWLINELKDGEDVEIGYLFPGGGGHFVVLTGGGYILGKPWLAYKHDRLQTTAPGTVGPAADPGDTKGLETVYTWAVDTDGDGNVNINGGVNNVVVAFSESPKTGDNTYPYLGASLISLLAGSILFIRRKARELSVK